MESVSAADREGRQEITVTGRESAFDTLVIAQMFSDVINISKTDLGTRSVNGELFSDCRIGFEWRGGRRIPEKKVPEQEISSGMKKRPGVLEDRRCDPAECRGEKSADSAALMMIIRMEAETTENALFLAECVIRSDVESTYGGTGPAFVRGGNNSIRNPG